MLEVEKPVTAVSRWVFITFDDAKLRELFNFVV